MNKKITVQNEEGKIRYCILDGEKDLERQFNEWYFGNPYPGGIKAYFDGKTFEVGDIYTREIRASFDVISIEDTDGEILLEWMDPETNQTGWL